MILADFAVRLLTLAVVGGCVLMAVALLADHFRRARAATTPPNLQAVADPVRVEQMLAIYDAETAWNEDVWAEDVRHDNGLRVIRGDVA